jgi:hypothetical protein
MTEATAGPTDRATGASPPSPLEPFHLLAALAASAVLLRSALRPIRDVDVHWHLLIGKEVLESRTVRGLGNDWAVAGEADWATTQWLSEVVLVAVHELGGWAGLLVGRQVLVIAILAATAWAILPGRPARVAAPVYAMVTLPLWSVVTQERPQTPSLLFVVLLAVWLGRAVSTRELPRLALVAIVVVVWANLHGLWVLTPAVFALVTLAWRVDGMPRREWQRPLKVMGVAAVCGVITPLGASGLAAPLVFQDRAAYVLEWQHSDLVTGPGLALLFLVALIMLAWARSGDKIPRGEVLVVAALLGFAVLANRNLAPAVLLMAPLVAERGSRTWPSRYEPTPAEARRLLIGASAVVSAALAGSLVMVSRIDPLADVSPRVIAAELADRPGKVRALNSYDASGVLAYFGGPDVRLIIDGRADRYPLEYQRSYRAALALEPGWEEFVGNADPDVAVLSRTVPLAHELVQNQGWREVTVDGGYVLLEPPQ